MSGHSFHLPLDTRFALRPDLAAGTAHAPSLPLPLDTRFALRPDVVRQQLIFHSIPVSHSVPTSASASATSPPAALPLDTRFALRSDGPGAAASLFHSIPVSRSVPTRRGTASSYAGSAFHSIPVSHSVPTSYWWDFITGSWVLPLDTRFALRSDAWAGPWRCSRSALPLDTRFALRSDRHRAPALVEAHHFHSIPVSRSVPTMPSTTSSGVNFPLPLDTRFALRSDTSRADPAVRQ